ncbi:SusC/RagA family TonB-linked outer membrane protein [Flavivirga sp. 57AJ16]|uniref:SusC/RagA family TonB-linked outer membrane protein n=1 Tax=Flavivirga sp. 57AJ16 TaxID=3025307 RepID=UPI00236733BB|nr:SusC/RagA family TonB-linked outer membrane protein [Flavivirga sp. 57AJ16]MDD7885414.1 SusC/RagA family TonB-linked outer membrane protein [Flavivirga sp. 57AJ16]
MIYKFKEIKLTNGLFFHRKDLMKLMMRAFIFLFCMTLFGLAPRYVVSQNDKIVIDSDQVLSVDEIFQIVKLQTDYMFVYHRDLFKDFPKVALKKGVIRLHKLLNQSLSEEDVSIIVAKNNTILIKKKTSKPIDQGLIVSGRVTDQAGLGVPDATVLIKGTRRGTVTDLDGYYKISVPDPAHVLVFSSLGFKSQEITVGNQTTINISLKEDIDVLGAVTIEAGYYKTSQRKSTGSISKIEAKTIEKQPVNNPLAAMQGHLPGVNIQPLGGLSGGAYRIQIRGTNFIDGGIAGTANDPLYIVNGVPYDTGSLEGLTSVVDFGLSQAGVSPLNTINPANIKSIEVLKDADATAIYGSRGANGVVLITTKKGRAGKTQVRLNVSSSLGEVTSFVNLLNTEQYLEMRHEALANDGYTLETAPVSIVNNSPDLYLWDQDRYTDWQEVLIGGTAYRQNAQLSFSGGSEQTQFLLSGSYVNETTVFPGDSKYSKATVSFNINHQSEDGRFKINASANYGSDTNNLPGANLVDQARKLAPNAPALYDEQGNLNWENSTWKNPLAILETTYNGVTRNLIANTVLSYRPVPSLEFKTNLGYTDYRLASQWAQPHTAFDPNTAGRLGSSISQLTTNIGTRQSWIIEPQINWQQDWDGARLKLLAGATFQQNKDQQLGIFARGFASNSLILDITAAESTRILQDDASEYKYQSFFGRINLDWQDRYILNLTGRRDGSSRFGPGKRFGYFGAIGTAWLFSEENLFKDTTVLSLGKLRASYGITGSDNVGNYKFYDAFEVSGIYNSSGLSTTSLFNPDYAWEETKKLEVALELGFIKNRIFLSAAWYRNRSSNQLIDAPIPGTTGFISVNKNLEAIVENSGLEIELRTINIKNEHFKWSTTFNISTNRNKLVAYPGLEGSFDATRYVLGESLQGVKQYRFTGIDPDTGIYQVEDFNNDGLIDFKDRQHFTDYTPKYFGGMGNTIRYKNLQLDLFFEFKKQIKRKDQVFYGAPGRYAQNMPVTVLDRWQQPGDENPIQAYSISNNAVLTAQSWYGTSDGATTDASFIRLRNISLSYTVPKTVTKGLDLNIYLHGQNLFIITKYDGVDPDRLFSQYLPPLRQFTFGLNLGF